MSDEATRRRGPSGRTRQRRKGAPRGGRHGLTRPAMVVPDEDAVLVEESFAVTAPSRLRRPMKVAAAPAAELNRETEFSYIRSDMRRLFIIAGGLLALMLVLLVVISR